MTAALLDRAFGRLPSLRETPLRQIFCGPESFTPDDQFLLGETPEIDGLFVAAGFNSIGIQAAGGVGWVLADWILDGARPMDLWEVDSLAEPRRAPHCAGSTIRARNACAAERSARSALSARGLAHGARETGSFSLPRRPGRCSSRDRAAGRSGRW